MRKQMLRLRQTKHFGNSQMFGVQMAVMTFSFPSTEGVDSMSYMADNFGINYLSGPQWFLSSSFHIAEWSVHTRITNT